TARTLGADVTVIEPLEHPLAGPLGSTAAADLVALHASHGVRVMAGMAVDSFLSGRAPIPEPFVDSGGEPGDPARVRGLRLTDGSEMAADVVLIAIGCQ